MRHFFLIDSKANKGMDIFKTSPEKEGEKFSNTRM